MTAPPVMTLDADSYPRIMDELKGLAVVRCWAPWSPSCAEVKNTISSLWNKRNEDFQVIELNIDRNQKLAEALKVRYLPEILILRDGQEVARMIGEFTEDELAHQIDIWLTGEQGMTMGL